MKEYLERFSKRMEFVAAADSIVGRTNRNQDIERLFSDGELDNILMSVLVFIMETTLTEDQDCTIDAITDFLTDILPSYGKHMLNDERETLARYFVKDILQNKGEMRNVKIMDYSGNMNNYQVRLVADKLGDNNVILYELTKQGFDFLFRTKEVDDELGFEIETIRLRMLINKKNYKKAISQSKYILTMLVEKRNELRQFEQQMRHDIFSVSGAQYDAVVSAVDAMLKEEYGEMRDIEHLLEQAQARLDEEGRLDVSSNEKTMTARREIVNITDNVRRALNMQQELLTKCENLRKMYLSLLNDSLLYQKVKRYDIEEQILRRMESISFNNIYSLTNFRAGLLVPLFLPDMKRTLNLSMLYDRQVRLRENDIEDIVDEDETEDNRWALERIQARNAAHVKVIRLLLEYGRNCTSFMFHNFWEHIKTHKDFAELTDERLVFLDMLKLYELRDINIEQWRKDDFHTSDCMGEFDLNYCLTCCKDNNQELFGIERIMVERTDERVICKVNTEEVISINDLCFIVSVRSETA